MTVAEPRISVCICEVVRFAAPPPLVGAPIPGPSRNVPRPPHNRPPLVSAPGVPDGGPRPGGSPFPLLQAGAPLLYASLSLTLGRWAPPANGGPPLGPARLHVPGLPSPGSGSSGGRTSRNRGPLVDCTMKLDGPGFPPPS